MAAERTERLINLVICLLHTRSFISAERLRETIPGYSDAASDEAFKRMFERDKEDLRDLGIPLETGSLHNFDDEIGYRITRGDYALPDLTLEPDEAAAVGLAARMWSSAALGASATRALRKLEAAGVEITPLPEGLQPGVGAVSRGLPTVAEAAREGRRVRFDYRGASDSAPAARHVEPWGVVWWHGRWYLAGHDLDRAAPRVFRLSRILGEPAAEGAAGTVTVPEGVDLTALVSASDPPDSDLLARIKVRHDRAIGLRRQTIDVVDDGGGWDVLTVPCPDPYALADQVLGYGADAVILAPAEARQAVVRRLETLVGEPQ
jgi:proteasome accessory factor B